MNRASRMATQERALLFEIRALAGKLVREVVTTEAFQADEERLPVLAFGWTLILTCDPCAHGKRWHFSAKLYPAGRGSDADDWQILGVILAAVSLASGHPTQDTPIAPIVPFAEEHPNAAHHFAWHEDGSPVCQASVSAVDLARRVLAERGKAAN